MQVVVADVAPHGALQACLGQGGAVHLHDLVQACVGHGHVASELGDGGVGLAALVDEHVHALGHRVAEEALRLAVEVGAGNPGVRLVGAHLFHEVGDLPKLLVSLVLALADEFHENAAAGPLGRDGQGGEGTRGGALVRQYRQSRLVEELHGAGAGDALAGGAGEVHGLLLLLKEAAHAPRHGRGRQKLELDLADDAQGAVASHEQVDCVHAGRGVVARGVLHGRHGVGGHGDLDAAALLGREAEDAVMLLDLPARKGERLAVGQHDAKGAHMGPHRAVAVGARAAGVAGHHAADRRGHLGGVGGEEDLRTLLEGLPGGHRRVVEARAGDVLVGKVAAQLRQDQAGLHTHEEPGGAPAVVTGAHAQVGVHFRKVHDVPACRNRAGGEARAAALHAYRRTRAALLVEAGKLGKHLPNVIGRARKRDRVGVSAAARLIL